MRTIMEKGAWVRFRQRCFYPPYPECRVHHGFRTTHKADDRAVSGIGMAAPARAILQGLKDKMIQPRLPLQLQLMAMRGVINDVEKKILNNQCNSGNEISSIGANALVPVQHGYGFHQAAVHPVEGTRQGGNFIFTFGRKLWISRFPLLISSTATANRRTGITKNIGIRFKTRRTAVRPISDVIESRKDLLAMATGNAIGTSRLGANNLIGLPAKTVGSAVDIMLTGATLGKLWHSRQTGEALIGRAIYRAGPFGVSRSPRKSCLVGSLRENVDDINTASQSVARSRGLVGFKD